MPSAASPPPARANGAWTTSLSVAVAPDATLPPPEGLPLASTSSHPLPPPKQAAPVPLPADPLSSKAEVRAVAEPTGLYGPLLEVMAAVRTEVNDVLTGWKEWEDAALGGVFAAQKQAEAARTGSRNGSRSTRAGDGDDPDEDDEDDDDD